MNIARYGLMMLLAVPLACAMAGHASAQAAQGQNGQTQEDSLAAAARRAREKQKEQPKAAKVWDNDNIPTSGGVDVVGNAAPSAPAPGNAAAEKAAESEKPSAEPAKKKSDLQAQLKAAQDDLKNLQTSLDFAQRKLALDQQSYYQKPNYASDTAGAQALQDEQSEIDAKKQQVDAAQKKVDDLQAQIESAGGGDEGEKNTGGSGGPGVGTNSNGNQNSSSGSPQ